MTPDELNRAVTSLRNVGGLYELVALHVEHANRPHVTREDTMHPHYDDGETTIYLDDCLAVLRELPDNSVDAVVTDPPYGLSNTDPRHVREALEHWLSGDRAFLPTVGGGGFMGKAWDSFVPPVTVWDECFRVLKPGGHLLSFAGSRTFDLMTLAIRLAGFDIRDSIAWLYGGRFVTGERLKPSFEPIALAKKAGPPTLQLDAVRVGDELRFNPSAGNKAGGASLNMSASGMPLAEGRAAVGRWAPNVVIDEAQAEILSGVSRFFYVAKAPKSERPVVDGVAHPTVKPLALMRWLIRLVTPAGGVVLEPFTGSGTTVEAAILEGVRVIGIERETDYWPLIRTRIARGNGVEL